MRVRPIMRTLAGAFVAGGAVGVVLALMVHAAQDAAAAPAADDLARVKASFRRPAAVPFPTDNPFSEKKRVLGETLFHDPRLSIDNSRSCASCHDRAKG